MANSDLSNNLVSRRDFLKLSGTLAAVLALPKHFSADFARALAANPRLPVIWLEFQDCTGDTESLLRAGHRPDPMQDGKTLPTISELLLDLISLEYHETLMAPAGQRSEKSLSDVLAAYPGQYLVVVEGAIPTANNGIYCMIRGRTAMSILQQSISDWPNSSPSYFDGVKTRLQKLVSSGQLGIFANGYWGHPAYQLPPEGNLLAVAHYLEALEWQREFIQIQAYLGGKNPHPQTYLVGGVAIPADPASQFAMNSQMTGTLRGLASQGLDFVKKVYLPDLLLIASFYKEWAALGSGPGNYLSFGDFPTDVSGSPASLFLPQGVILNRAIQTAPQPLDPAQIKEYVTQSWYTYSQGDQDSLHPSNGETLPSYSGPNPPFEFLDTGGKYSWLKAPRYQDTPMEVGPLARMLVAYAAGQGRVVALVQQVLDSLKLGPEALFSTLGRVAARGIETQLIAEQMGAWIDQLEAKINSGNLATHNGEHRDPATWPADAVGMGITEAPRGALGHWVNIQNGKILNYQMVVPIS